MSVCLCVSVCVMCVCLCHVCMFVCIGTKRNMHLPPIHLWPFYVAGIALHYHANTHSVRQKKQSCRGLGRDIFDTAPLCSYIVDVGGTR